MAATFACALSTPSVCHEWIERRRRIVKALNAMADHATGAAATEHDQALTGDPEALRRARRAGYGRTVARRTVAHLQAIRGDEDAS